LLDYKDEDMLKLDCNFEKKDYFKVFVPVKKSFVITALSYSSPAVYAL